MSTFTIDTDYFSLINLPLELNHYFAALTYIVSLDNFLDIFNRNNTSSLVYWEIEQTILWYLKLALKDILVNGELYVIN